MGKLLSSFFQCPVDSVLIHNFAHFSHCTYSDTFFITTLHIVHRESIVFKCRFINYKIKSLNATDCLCTLRVQGRSFTSILLLFISKTTEIWYRLGHKPLVVLYWCVTIKTDTFSVAWRPSNGYCKVNTFARRISFRQVSNEYSFQQTWYHHYRYHYPTAFIIEVIAIIKNKYHCRHHHHYHRDQQYHHRLQHRHYQKQRYHWNNNRFKHFQKRQIIYSILRFLLM